LELQNDGMCFACGPRNPIGLKLQFNFEDGRYVARFTPRQEHQGYDSMMHGGLISTLLDEAMAKLVYEKGNMAVTGELHVRFKKPACVGEELAVYGWITSDARRVIDCAAEIRNAKGEIVAEATGRMVRV
jgi:uncharacterized protein (TIGR00369 family)